MTAPLPIGISSCLLGERVRYDGRMKRADHLIERLAGRVRWVSMCPEVGSGLGTPRPPMDLFQTRLGVRLRTLDGAHDYTDAMSEFAVKGVALLVSEGACGMVFKSRSPSCGVGDARLHHGATEQTDGLMVRAVRAALPGLPLVRDEELMTSGAQERFLAQALEYRERRGASPDNSRKPG